MATAVAKYAGEPVAVVVATSSARAQDALAMIEVEYEALPAVLDLEKAVEGGIPLGSAHLWVKQPQPAWAQTLVQTRLRLVG